MHGEIRLGHIDRNNAISLVNYYQSKKPKHTELFRNG